MKIKNITGNIDDNYPEKGWIKHIIDKNWKLLLNNKNSKLLSQTNLGGFTLG